MPRAMVEQGFAPALMESESAPIAVRVEADLAAAEPLWRAAEAKLVATPYQRFDACAAWARTIGVAEGVRLAVVISTGSDGAPRLILPLAIARRGPLQLARVMGGKHTNFSVPLFAPDAFATGAGERIGDILTRAAWLADIDLFAFPHVPLTWLGAANPLAALPGMVSANIALRGELGTDAETTLRRIRGGLALRKLRGKEKKLAAIGAMRHVKARSDAEKTAVVAAFHAQKATWFRERGIADVFSPPEAAAYVAALAASGTFEFHALEVGDKIVATAAGGLSGDRFSMAFNSYDPDFARMSPGDVLLREIVTELVSRGTRHLDCGVGDAEYKRHWLSENDPMLDIAFGVGPVGRTAAATLALGWRMKRRIKSDPRLARVAKWLRRERPTEKAEG